MSLDAYNAARGLDKQSDNQDAAQAQMPTVRRTDLIDITEKRRKYGDQPLIILTSSFLQAKDNLGKYDDYALVLRRCVDHEDKALNTTLEVQSPVIQKALKIALADYGYLNLDARPIKIQKPYDALFHYRHELRAYAAAEERTEEEKLHMEVLTKFMHTNLAVTEREYDQLAPNNMITFPLLWALFRAEDIIIEQTDHYQQGHRVISCGEKIEKDRRFFEIQGWTWGYNGTKFGPSLGTICIEEFVGARKITELDVYPLRMIPTEDQDHLHTQFVERGHKWRSFVDITNGEYDGPIWVDNLLEKANEMGDLVVEYTRGRIVLDADSHQQNNHKLTTRLVGGGLTNISSSRRSSISSTYSWVDRAVLGGFYDPVEHKHGSLNDAKCHLNDSHYHMTDDQAFLAPARVPGFALSPKKWAFFLVSKVMDVKWRDNAFGKLELDPTIKSTIQALVQTHNSTSYRFDDFIREKGKGLIMLLYGPPGAGKTLTAESIAELTHRPLYYIGAAELGTDAQAAERSLKRVFELAKTWDAVLLLDEADVFLSKRTKDDMVRNAFVAVFLRLLEYYQGILFLTTNRLEEFDAAFQSRIHLSVEYFPLDAKKRAGIWRNLLSTIEECRTWSDEVYNRIGEDLVLNGREIKNLIKTSLALAIQKREDLTEADLRLIYSFNHMSLKKWGH